MKDHDMLSMAALGPGAIRDRKDGRDYRLCSITPPVAVEKQRFLIEDKFPVKYQDGRGSCTSHAQTHHKERQEGKPLAARFVMALTKKLEGNTNYGAYTRNTFKVVNDTGACEERLYPEPPPSMSWEEYVDHTKIPAGCFKDAAKHKSQSYWRVENTLDDLRRALVTYKNSVCVSMAWYSEFNSPKNGLIPTTFSRYVGGHAVDCVGFDDFKEHLIIKNSYSNRYGDKGYFYLPYGTFDTLIWDLWTSVDIPANLPVDDRYGQLRTWQTFMREKSMAFNPWLYGKIGRLPNNREIKGLAYGYWDFEYIFKGKGGDVWLHHTKPEAIKKGLI